MKKVVYALHVFLEWPTMPLFMPDSPRLRATFWNERMRQFYRLLAGEETCWRSAYLRQGHAKLYVDQLLTLYLKLVGAVRNSVPQSDEEPGLQTEHGKENSDLNPFLEELNRFADTLPVVSKKDLFSYACKSFFKLSFHHLDQLLDAYLCRQMLPLLKLNLVSKMDRLNAADQVEMIHMFHRTLFSREDGILAFRQYFYREWKQYLLRFEHYKLPLQIQIWFDAVTYLYPQKTTFQPPDSGQLTAAAQIALHRNHFADALWYVAQDKQLEEHTNLLLLAARAARMLRAWDLCKRFCLATMRAGLYLEELYADLSYAHYNLKEFRQAIAVAGEGIVRFQQRAQLYIALAYAQLYGGKYADAMETFIRVAKLPMLKHHQLDVYLGMARTAYQLNRPYTVFSCLKKAQRLAPQNEAVRREYADYLYEFGYLKDALRELEHCFRYAPNDVQLYITMCTILAEIPNIKREMRRRAFSLLCEKAADRPELDAQLAVIAYNLGFSRDAWQFVQKAILADEKNLSNWSILCDILIGEEAFTEALHVSEWMLKLDETVQDSYLTKGDILVRLGEYNQALACYDLCQNKTGMSADLAGGRKEIYGYLGLENERAKWEHVEAWWRLRESETLPDENNDT